MSTAAKDIATFVIEPIGTDIYNPDSWTVRKRFQGEETTTTYTNTGDNGYVMFNAINTEAFKPTTSGSSMRGARIYLKNGLYLLNHATSSLWWSDDTDADIVKLHLEGETRDGTIIRNASGATGGAFMATRCSAEISNLTMDGNNLTNTMNAWNAISNNSGNDKTIGARNVRFTKIDGYGMRLASASNWQYAYAINCIFEKPKASEDRCSLHAIKGILVDGNTFDRTNGEYTGSGQAITGSTDADYVVSNNIIKMPDVNSAAIAMENNLAISKINIHDNIIEYGKIKIGMTSQSFVAQDIIVKNNIIIGQGIDILGPSTGDHSNTIKYVNVEGNLIKQAYSTAVKLEDLGGLVVCRYNTIIDSNRSLSTGDHGGLIWANDCTDVDIEYNVLEMNDKSPADALYSKYGIRYATLVNSRIANNIIRNKTTQGQVAYQDGGSHSGTNVFSRSVW